MAIKQAILQHEYGEVIKDQFSDYGHLHLIIRQAQKLGLTPQEVHRHQADRQHDGDALCLGLADARQELGRRIIRADGYRMDQR